MVNLNSLVDEKPRVKKSEQPNEYKHLYGEAYLCISAQSGTHYTLILEDNLVFYTCQCRSYAFRQECSHGKQLCERLADGENFDKPRIVSETPFDFDNAPLLDSVPAKRKPTLEEIFSY